MGNRDKRNDKVKKPKKAEKPAVHQVLVGEVPPPVEVIRKKKKDTSLDED